MRLLVGESFRKFWIYLLIAFQTFTFVYSDVAMNAVGEILYQALLWNVCFGAWQSCCKAKSLTNEKLEPWLRSATVGNESLSSNMVVIGALRQ